KIIDKDEIASTVDQVAMSSVADLSMMITRKHMHTALVITLLLINCLLLLLFHDHLFARVDVSIEYTSSQLTAKCKQERMSQHRQEPPIRPKQRNGFCYGSMPIGIIDYHNNYPFPT
ncbi:hypothetical protein RDWZM_006289, partial [Blomia tropicalis]